MIRGERRKNAVNIAPHQKGKRRHDHKTHWIASVSGQRQYRKSLNQKGHKERGFAPDHIGYPTKKGPADAVHQVIDGKRESKRRDRKPEQRDGNLIDFEACGNRRKLCGHH